MCTIAKYIAEMMKEKYGTPYLEVDLYGIQQTADDLRKNSQVLQIRKQSRRSHS